MDYLKPADFRKIKAFFIALKDDQFKVNSSINSATVVVDGIPTPVNKTECLNLLRSFPELRGEEFKDDNFLIKYLQDPLKRKHLLGKLTPQQQIELTQVFEEKPVAVGALSEQPGEQEQPPVEESPATMAEGGGFPGIAGGGTVAPAPRRIIHIVPHAPEPETTTSSSSQATIKTTTTPAPSAKPGSATVTSSTGFTPTGSTSISSTTSSSGTTNIETKTQIHAPEETTQPAKGIKAGGTKFQAPKISLSITNAGRGLFSKAGMFLKKNFATLASAGTGFFAGLGITGGSVFGGLMGGAGGTALRFWAGGGGAGRFFNKFLNGSANFVNRLSFNIAGPKIPGPSGSFLKGGRAAVLGFGIFFFMAFGLALFDGATSGTAAPAGGSGTGGTSPVIGGSCPDQAAIDSNKKDPDTCRYFNLGVNLFDINISSDVITKYIDKYSPIFINAGKGSSLDFLQRVDYIISNSKNAGLNPAIFLGYWKTESNFSTAGIRDLGCSPDAVNFYEQVDCALGIKAFSNPQKNPIPNCARSKDPNSVACNALKEIRKTLDITNPIKYPVATFDDFAEAHGSRDPGLDGPGTTNNNCIGTYNKLVEVAKELNACRAMAASCPVSGGQIKTSSYQADPTTGHCSPSYGSCPAESRRAKAIDVDTKGGDVLFPTINGQNVIWKYITDLSLNPSDCEGGLVLCGRFYVFRADVGGDYWMLHLLHLDPDPVNLAFNRTAAGNISGSKAGKTVAGIFLHVEIGKNIVNYSAPPLGSGDLDPGWIPSDFMCK